MFYKTIANWQMGFAKLIIVRRQVVQRPSSCWRHKIDLFELKDNGQSMHPQDSALTILVLHFLSALSRYAPYILRFPQNFLLFYKTFSTFKVMSRILYLTINYSNGCALFDNLRVYFIPCFIIRVAFRS